MLQGLVCGIAGVLLASRITSGQPNAATGLELSVISACVLGGVSLAGGRAAMAGVVVGVLIMGIAENVMNLLNIQAFYQYVVRGLILLLAVCSTICAPWRPGDAGNPDMAQDMLRWRNDAASVDVSRFGGSLSTGFRLSPERL
jgi:hypothetical protein